VQAVALPVLRHRIIPNFAAHSEQVSSDDIVKRLLETIPTDDRLYDGRSGKAQVAVS
jgi:MoxR-like ATPase